MFCVPGSGVPGASALAAGHRMLKQRGECRESLISVCGWSLAACVPQQRRLARRVDAARVCVCRATSALNIRLSGVIGSWNTVLSLASRAVVLLMQLLAIDLYAERGRNA